MKDAAILVVEADAQERDRLLQALAACTDLLRLQAAPDEGAALDFLFGRGAFAGRDARKQPRLVLMGLDEAPGLALLQTMRTTPQTQAVPVVRLSPPGTPRELQDAWYKAGANSLVGRTEDDQELRRKMRQVHDFWLTVNEADRHSRV